MKRKTYLLVSVVVLLSLVLSACSAGGSSSGSTKPKLRVATEASYPPFENVDENTKELIGFDIDLMKAVAAKSGYEVDFQNTPFDSVLTGVSTCQVDAAISAITITEERRKKMSFSDAYIAAGQIVTVRADNTTINGSADLPGKRIGVQLGTTGEIEAKKFEGTTIKPYDTVDLVFLDLMNGQVDAAVVDNPTTLVYVNKNKDKLKTVGQPFTNESYGIAVCKTKADVLEKINKALAELKQDGTIAKLQDQWLK